MKVVILNVNNYSFRIGLPITAYFFLRVKISKVNGVIVESGSKYMIELKNGERIPIGITKYKDIKAKWI